MSVNASILHFDEHLNATVYIGLSILSLAIRETKLEMQLLVGCLQPTEPSVPKA